MAKQEPNASEIRSDYGGIIISVDKAKGQFVSPGEKIATVGVNNGSFNCEITCPAFEGRFIEVGDEARISAAGMLQVVRGTVSELQVDGETLRVTVSCESDVPKGGENATVLIEKFSENYDVIVPGEAVHQEGFSQFVWMLRPRMGSFGIEYYAVKVKVIVADSDEQYAAISRGLEYYREQPVVTSYDKEPAVNGSVLRMD
jgi:multidrug efflux pump subunit AcrA (membrane-fusion protein)